MKIFKKLFWIVLIVFLLAQFFRPEKNVGDMTSIDGFLKDTNPPEDVALILKESCYDCHSGITKYPWYNNITPVNYWMKGHVDHGKGHFNVSKWDAYSIKKKDHKLEELIEMVEEKTMPLKSYTWMHSEANLTNQQIEAIIKWAEGVRLRYSFLPKPE